MKRSLYKVAAQFKNAAATDDQDTPGFDRSFANDITSIFYDLVATACYGVPGSWDPKLLNEPIFLDEVIKHAEHYIKNYIPKLLSAVEDTKSASLTKKLLKETRARSLWQRLVERVLKYPSYKTSGDQNELDADGISRGTIHLKGVLENLIIDAKARLAKLRKPSNFQTESEPLVESKKEDEPKTAAKKEKPLFIKRNRDYGETKDEPSKKSLKKAISRIAGIYKSAQHAMFPDIVPGAKDENNSEANNIFNQTVLNSAKTFIDNLLVSAARAAQQKNEFYPSSIDVGFQVAMKGNDKPDPSTIGLQQVYIGGSKDVSDWVANVLNANRDNIKKHLAGTINPKVQALQKTNKSGYEGRNTAEEAVYVTQRATVRKNLG